jgi:hypothetical protein
MKPEWHHQDQEATMHLEEAAGQLRAKTKVQESRDGGPGIKAQATLAAGKQDAARRIGVVRLLAAHGAE